MVNERVIEFGLSMMFEELYADRERCYPPRQKADSSYQTLEKTMLIKEYLHNEPIVQKRNQNFCNHWIMKIVREHDKLFIIEFTDGTWTNWHTYNSHFEVAFPYF